MRFVYIKETRGVYFKGTPEQRRKFCAVKRAVIAYRPTVLSLILAGFLLYEFSRGNLLNATLFGIVFGAHVQRDQWRTYPGWKVTAG